MHPHLLLDVIKRQAGTLGKAIAEGGMNAADARASNFDIGLGTKRVTLVDDGSGIKDRESITKFWETFGAPPEETDPRIYGHFRMGRGQMFAFGKNRWRTSRFSMVVDINSWKDNYDYDLTFHGGAAKNGCEVEIDLYEPLSPSLLRETEKEVKQLLKYMEITGLTVTLNGKRISIDPVEENWDHEMSEGFVRLKRSGTLDVYNLGAFVKSYPQDLYGTGGVVVAAKQLKVNFARNDVMVRDCEVWKALMKDVKKRAKAAIKRRPSLNDAERARIAADIMDGEGLTSKEAAEARVFTDVCGRHWSAEQFVRNGYKYSQMMSLAPQNSSLGDKLHKQKAAFILGQDTSDRFGDMSLEDLVALIIKLGRANSRFECYHTEWSAVPFQELIAGLDENYVIVPKEQWTPTEKLLMQLLAGSEATLAYKVRDAQGQAQTTHRALMVGESAVAEGWTDGRSYIALRRDLLTTRNLTMRGLLDIHHVLLHEMCHDEPDTGGHGHTHEFYQVFHDCERRMTAQAVNAFKELPKMLERAGRKVTSTQLRDLDRIFAVEKGVADLVQKMAASAVEKGKA